jgi:hypothetical protein
MNSTTPDEFLPVPDRNPSVPRGIEDRFLYWPIILALGWPVALVLVSTAPDPWAFVALLAVELFWVVTAFGAFIAALVRLRRRAWRQSASMLILSLTALAAFLNKDFIVHAVQQAGSDLQLLATLPTYSREISKLPADQGPRLRVFLWRDLNGFALYLGYELLVYDESDEIALPAQERSQGWKEKAAATDLHCRLGVVRHAFGHFYFVGRGFEC